MPIPHRLQQLRGTLKKAQAAKKAGVSAANWSRWETGEHVPTYEQAKKVADAFGVTVEFILEGEQKFVVSEEAQEYKPTREALMEQQTRTRRVNCKPFMALNVFVWLVVRGRLRSVDAPGFNRMTKGFLSKYAFSDDVVWEMPR